MRSAAFPLRADTSSILVTGTTQTTKKKRMEYTPDAIHLRKMDALERAINRATVMRNRLNSQLNWFAGQSTHESEQVCALHDKRFTAYMQAIKDHPQGKGHNADYHLELLINVHRSGGNMAAFMSKVIGADHYKYVEELISLNEPIYFIR